jgi:hypothetical protein
MLTSHATRVICYPPLGQTTVVSGSQVRLSHTSQKQAVLRANLSKIRFSICIELDREAAERIWEAVLWHSTDDGEWAGLPFSSLANAADVGLSPDPVTCKRPGLLLIIV